MDNRIPDVLIVRFEQVIGASGSNGIGGNSQSSKSITARLAIESFNGQRVLIYKPIGVEGL